MGATEEQMQLLHNAGITHVSYVLILYSIAFILFLCKWTVFIHCPFLGCWFLVLTFDVVVNILLHIYAVHAWPNSAKPSAHSRSSSTTDPVQDSTFINGHARSASESQQVHDAEAFELQGLISDEEDEDMPGNRSRAMGPRKAEDEESAPLVGKETSST
jgi:glucan phosphoethanolaminetransferase (alkaline phosphatase superfamily)